VLVGQSLGGAVALTAAAQLPVAGVVALSTPYELPPGRPYRPHWPWRVDAKAVPAHQELGLRREAEYPAYAAFPRRVEREARLVVEQMRKALPVIAIPVLVVASEADPWFPATPHGRGLTAELRNARLLVLEGVGHSIALDPDRAAAFQAIREFVASV
jgi:pimeloyl-ACP methyl ester carboxylesterase